MSFTVLLLILAIVSAGLLFLLRFFKIEIKSLLINYLQIFFGLLFIVSGFVKAVDPLGFSYKMEEYFQEFQTLFEPTFLSFINPVFVFFEHHALHVGIFMIVLEMIIGVMLMIGFRPKLTAWAFFLLMLFFTILTGYTYLTGYVPKEANFFEFSKWAAYDNNNMRVTDCGCFGDFIKFSAWHTFLKDLIMLVPGLLFIIKSQKKYRLFTDSKRLILIIASTILFYFFNLYNYKWSEPIIDFRPFREGVNIRERKDLELKAAANVAEKAIILQNKASGEIIELPSEQYNATISEYPQEKFSIMERIYEEPEIPTTEISDFLLEDLEGSDFTEDFLNDTDYSFLIVSPQMKGKPQPMSYTIQDTTFSYDTIKISHTDSFSVVKKILKTEAKQVEAYDYVWDEDYMKIIKQHINPLVLSATADSTNIYFASATSVDMVLDFIKDGGPYMIYLNSDDITLKTIMRSNPGVALFKDGVILKKWHYKQLPSYEEIKRKFMK
ncbi:MAG: DoxX family protein [Deltaproteobacteria bacterium]